MSTEKENDESVADNETVTNEAEADDVRLHLVSMETGEPFLNADGEPEILDAETSRILIEEAAKDGVSVEEKLAQVIDAAISKEEDNDNQEQD